MKGHRPAAMTTNGSAGATSVQAAGSENNSPSASRQIDPVLTPVAPADHELEIAPGQRMEPVSYPDTPVPIIWIGCSRRRRPTPSAKG